MKFKVLDTENNEFVEKFVIDQDGNVMVGDDYCGACDQPKYSTVEQPLLLIEANADTDACTRTCPDLRELRQENERLRTALEFYTDSRKYHISEKYSGGEFIGSWAEICGDSGNVARRALKEGKHE